MSMNKFVVAAGLMAGAAFALAPLASADTDPLAPVVAGEISSMNFLFEGDTALAGDSSDVTTHANNFDTITTADVGTVQGDGTTPFDYLVYGLNPSEAGLASDPGAYSLFNGALIPFDDAINSLMFASMNDGAVLGWDGGTGDLFGGNSAMDIANTATTGWDEASSYFQLAWGDLMGYFGIFSS